MNSQSINKSAEVVKLVDAVDSKSSGCKPMPVRVRPSAPFIFGGLLISLTKSRQFNKTINGGSDAKKA